MIYVKRNKDNVILAVSREQISEDWEAMEDDAKEVTAFAVDLAGGPQSLVTTDLSLVRVVEDLIDLLIEQGVIRFTDLPQEAQNKLFARRTLRSSLRTLQLLDEDAGGGNLG